MKRFIILATLALVCATVLVGCGKSRKGLVPAQGVLTLNGAPVEGATVIFSPKTFGGEAVTSSAVTDKDGKFKMSTDKPGDGIFPSEYAVTVMKDVIEGGISLEEAKDRIENPDKYRGEKDPEQTVIHHIPVKYADMNTSGLSVTVPAGGDKNISIALEGEVDLTPEKLGAGHQGGR